MIFFPLFINGAERPSDTGTSFVTRDPATGEVIAELAHASSADVDAAVAAARSAQPDWARVSAANRGRMLQAVSSLILDRADELAVLESRDCGKVLSQARTDIALAARYFEYFGGIASALHGDQIPVGAGVVNFTTREPFGVSAQINAWNFPLNMAARSMAAALAAGNSVVVKSPELAPCTTAVLARLIARTDIPQGVVNVLHGGPATGESLCQHPGIGLLTFTGSVATGKSVAAAAAANVTPCVLELGGKSPTIVFDDADMDVADELAVGFVEANGQSCDLPSVALVHATVYDEFIERLTTRVSKMTVGPGVQDPDVGALVSEAQWLRVQNYILGAIEDGARIASGGGRLQNGTLGAGWYVEPTVLVDVHADMAAVREEIFGPVLCVLRFSSEQEAIALANDTEFGLAAFVWTRDLGRSLRVVQQIQAGQIYVNCFSSGDSVMTPFGGFGSSGYGREKGFEALRTYTQPKNVCLSTR